MKWKGQNLNSSHQNSKEFRKILSQQIGKCWRSGQNITLIQITKFNPRNTKMLNNTISSNDREINPYQLKEVQDMTGSLLHSIKIFKDILPIFLTLQWKWKRYSASKNIYGSQHHSDPKPDKDTNKKQSYRSTSLMNFMHKSSRRFSKYIIT